jgi:hypothetical protein
MGCNSSGRMGALHSGNLPSNYNSETVCSWPHPASLPRPVNKEPNDFLDIPPCSPHLKSESVSDRLLGTGRATDLRLHASVGGISSTMSLL